MRNYERNQVMVDQCSGCGGLFLDRGELERLYSAESAFYDRASAPASPPPASTEQPGYESRHHQKSKKKKARSFLEDFFE